METHNVRDLSAVFNNLKQSVDRERDMSLFDKFGGLRTCRTGTVTENRRVCVCV